MENCGKMDVVVVVWCFCGGVVVRWFRLYRTSTAASSERAGNSTVDPTSEGEIPESAPPATSGEYISEAEMSEPFGDERN